MALSDLQNQTLIRIETGTDDDSTVEDNIATWWEESAGSANQYQATKIRVLEYLQGKYRQEVDMRVGTESYTASQKFRQVTDMLTAARAQLAAATSSRNSYRSITPKRAIADT